MLETPDDVARALRGGGGLAGWEVCEEGEDSLLAARGPMQVLIAWPPLWADVSRLAPHLARSRDGFFALLMVGGVGELDGEAICGLPRGEGCLTLATLPMSEVRLELILRGWGDAGRARVERAAVAVELERSRYENNLLIDIGRALSRERDQAALLELILRRAREVTGADAGSVYLVQGDADEPGGRTLFFTESQNDSREVASEGFSMPVSSASIVGTCVLTAKVINIPDLYRLDAPGEGNNPWSVVHDRSFDEQYRYQTRSMVTIPMISARHQVIGVIQLINKRAPGVARLESDEDFQSRVRPFDDVSINYGAALASQAGIALENALLYEEVKALFDGFVHASVSAIESRDPTTSGHSERVAELTVGLAKVADRAESGPYADLRIAPDELKQIEYAALLHDFGKVGVREDVLVKAKKLHEDQRERIESRFELIRKDIEIEGLRAKLRGALEAKPGERGDWLAAADTRTEQKLAELNEFWDFIAKSNEPTVLECGGFEKIAEIAARHYKGADGAERPYLLPEESQALQISRGSLTEAERKEIESHVVHTLNFLRQIPWGRTYRHIPRFAASHHEKLDGSGYPEGLRGDQIPAPAKMMTISDIYDALTASDRPYKRAVPRERALDILSSEVRLGKLDPDLFEMFVAAELWTLVH